MIEEYKGDIDRRALRDQVYDSVLRILFAGEVEPGERLSIETIARDLQVSPTPVREALVHLERTGLVIREALKGYRVAPPLNRQQMTELFDARLMLETFAAEGASGDAPTTARSLSVAHRNHVRIADEIVRRHEQRERAPLNVTQAYFKADADFHAVMFKRANNRYAVEMYAQLDALRHRMRQAVHTGPADVREAVAEHAAILRAFELGVTGDIVAAVAAHINGVRTRALNELDAEDETRSD
ncbi:GntR family transcriptional regulator [Microbacterium sp. YY-01]|uniref:GntR family transcriptional regulator n=1 Tax=Microbacterium sp. YY-01 TaxID=3421634 RepID=UPI003D18574E